MCLTRKSIGKRRGEGSYSYTLRRIRWGGGAKKNFEEIKKTGAAFYLSVTTNRRTRRRKRSKSFLLVFIHLLQSQHLSLSSYHLSPNPTYVPFHNLLRTRHMPSGQRSLAAMSNSSSKNSFRLNRQRYSR